MSRGVLAGVYGRIPVANCGENHAEIFGAISNNISGRASVRLRGISIIISGRIPANSG